MMQYGSMLDAHGANDEQKRMNGIVCSEVFLVCVLPLLGMTLSFSFEYRIATIKCSPRKGTFFEVCDLANCEI